MVVDNDTREDRLFLSKGYGRAHSWYLRNLLPSAFGSLQNRSRYLWCDSRDQVAVQEAALHASGRTTVSGQFANRIGLTFLLTQPGRELSYDMP